MNKKPPAPRNRTLQISDQEKDQLLANCLYPAGEPFAVGTIRNKVICGDCFAALPLLPEKFADLIIADPPYNHTKNFNGNKFSKTSNAEYEEYTRNWISKVAPLLKDNGSIYVCCDWASSPVIANVLAEFFIIRNRITWEREKGRGAAGNWKNSLEDIYFATVSKDYTFNLDAVKIRRKVIAPYRDESGKPKDWQNAGDEKFRDSCPGNFWNDISIPFWSMPENTPHPTQKPEKLLAKLILASSNKGDMVFDPFLGSGSTAVTAKKLERDFCGVEIDPFYCACAGKRLQNADSDRSIQGFADGIFYERNSMPRNK